MKNTPILIRRGEIERLPSVTQMIGAGFRVSTAVAPKNDEDRPNGREKDTKKPRPETPDGENENGW